MDKSFELNTRIEKQEHCSTQPCNNFRIETITTLIKGCENFKQNIIIWRARDLMSSVSLQSAPFIHNSVQ